MLNIEEVKCEYCPYKQDIEKVKADVIDEYNHLLNKNFMNLYPTNCIGDIIDKTYDQIKLKVNKNEKTNRIRN